MTLRRTLFLKTLPTIAPEFLCGTCDACVNEVGDARYMLSFQQADVGPKAAAV